MKQTQIAQAVRIKPAPEADDEVADADDAIESGADLGGATPVVAQNEPAAAPSPELPKPILASYTPDSPVEHEISADAHEQGTPPPPQRLFAYASAGGMPSLPSLHAKPAPAPLPVYRDAEVVGAPEVDDDHAEEESYVPFEIAGLMTDASVAYSRTVAPMTHPDQGAIDYLFEDMDRPTSLTLRKSSGYAGLAAAQKFQGQAVRSLYAGIEPAAKEHAEAEPSAPSATRIAAR